MRFVAARDVFYAFASVGDDIGARPNGETPMEFLSLLASSATPEEAITFAAYLLDPRKAVWWGHECARSVIHLLTEQDRQMLSLAEAWVKEPGEDRRARALDAALACGSKTPGVWIALAAGWSGESRAAPAPATHLLPRAVNAGILGALARVDHGHRAQTLRTFTEMANGLTG